MNFQTVWSEMETFHIKIMHSNKTCYVMIQEYVTLWPRTAEEMIMEWCANFKASRLLVATYG